jgi:hypothetical protein
VLKTFHYSNSTGKRVSPRRRFGTTWATKKSEGPLWFKTIHSSHRNYKERNSLGTNLLAIYVTRLILRIEFSWGFPLFHRSRTAPICLIPDMGRSTPLHFFLRHSQNCG